MVPFNYPVELYAHKGAAALAAGNAVIAKPPSDCPLTLLKIAEIREETFGPVVPLVPFEKVADAVKMANDSPYGLQAAVFTNDISRALDVAHKLEVGGVIVNWSSAVRVESLPFGGIKLSGHGREGLHDTLKEMTEQKTILIHNALS